MKLLIKEELLRRWDECPNDGTSQIRVDATHLLDIFISRSVIGNRQIMLITKRRIKKLKSSNSISVEHLLTADGKFVVKFELQRSGLDLEFVYLCYDLIESSRVFTKEDDAVNNFAEKFYRWQLLLDNAKSDLLSDIEVKGLIGELLFIQSKLSKGEDAQKIIDAWKIHEEAERDFVFEDSWFEIKSVGTGADNIKISSLEQLDHNISGEVVVYFIDKLNAETQGAITLPLLIETTIHTLSISSALQLFNKKLLQKGYVARAEYKDKYFKFSHRQRYNVDKDFPKITRASVSPQIVSAHYEISIRAIYDWIIRE